MQVYVQKRTFKDSHAPNGLYVSYRITKDEPEVSVDPNGRFEYGEYKVQMIHDDYGLNEAHAGVVDDRGDFVRLFLLTPMAEQYAVENGLKAVSVTYGG